MRARNLLILGLVLTAIGLPSAKAQTTPPDEAKKTKRIDQLPQIEGIAHYVVYKSPDGDAELAEFDTFQFPKLGYIRPQPDLVLDSVRSARMNVAAIKASNIKEQKREQLGQPAVTIVLNDDNTAKLKDFSKKYTGQQILVVVNGIPVTAPVMLSPIEEGIITISGGNRTPEQMQEVLDAILELKGKPSKS